MNRQLLMEQAKLEELPHGWDIKPVGTACRIRNDMRKPISVEERDKIRGQFPYYGPTGVLGYINEFLVDGKFCLIGEDGDHFLKYDEKDQTLLVDGKCNVNNHAHIIEGTKCCSTEWFYHFFKHRNITPFLSRQGAGRYKLNKETLQKLPILLPPIPEQATISAMLSKWNIAIQRTDELIAAKERRLSSILQVLVIGRINNWNHRRADEIFKTITEKGNATAELLSVTQDRGVIPRTMLEGRVMSPEGGTGAYKLIKKGDFAISLRSFQGGLEFSLYEGLISPAYTVLRPKLEIYDDFYRHFFKSRLFIDKYLNIAVIGIRDGKQISVPDFMSVRIPCPPMDEQKEIAAVLSAAENEINLLKKQAEAYRMQKRGLMQKLLTGEWRVKTKEVA